ncbi:hypothetical protein KC887_00585 [Candidatus Kaiserbacteria bacterium]|nr:hypothetical protein [Candidatus Kaiserbacteria bacterium]
MNQTTKTALKLIRENKLNMRHIFKLGLRAQGKRVTDGELQRMYDGMCSYISQRSAPSKNQEAILGLGLVKFSESLLDQMEEHILEKIATESDTRTTNT